MAELNDYELQRQRNIAANLAILASLGLEKPAAAVTKRKPPPTPKTEVVKREVLKREVREKKRSLEEDGNDEVGQVESGRRKSARLSAVAKRKANPVSSESDMSDREGSIDHEGSRGRYNHGDKPGLPRRLVNGRYVAHIDPNFVRPSGKVFGAIPGVKVGQWWSMRQEASVAGVHAPFVAGIFGSAKDGAYSVALSGGYEDDIDEGFRFTFTGAGGRELKKKNLRTAPQSKDQTLTGGNMALVRSFETQMPVRVIRGFKGDKKWAPKSGYRYDGLYQVCKWWNDRGLSGYKVYKYAFKRIDGQPPIDLNTGPAEVSDEDEAEEGDEWPEEEEESGEEEA